MQFGKGHNITIALGKAITQVEERGGGRVAIAMMLNPANTSFVS